MNVASSASPRFPNLDLPTWRNSSPRKGGCQWRSLSSAVPGSMCTRTWSWPASAPGPAGERETKIASFSTFTDELLALRDWLVSLGVTRVGMEATGVYWKPIFYVLEDELDCWLLNARHMRNVPGRKTDVGDAQWICQLTEHGLVRASFVPPAEIRDIRELTRYRRSQVEERSREAQRLDKVLQDAGVKLSSVASDILGTSGRAMLSALVSGTDDPAVVADLAKGLLRKKLPQLRRALVGHFGPGHAILVSEIIAHLDYFDEAIGRLSEAIDERIAPYLWGSGSSRPGREKVDLEPVVLGAART